MQTRLHPATRRIAWLVVIIGGGATLIAAITALLNKGTGIVLPLTTCTLDAGWLLIFGLLWLITGLLALWWLRPDAGEVRESEDYHSRITRSEARLSDLDKAVQAIQAQLKAPTPPANQNAPLLQKDLNFELDNLGTAIQDAHRRLDDLGNVNAEIDDLRSQLDALYVTLHDIHQRIDGLEKHN